MLQFMLHFCCVQPCAGLSAEGRLRSPWASQVLLERGYKGGAGGLANGPRPGGPGGRQLELLSSPGCPGASAARFHPFPLPTHERRKGRNRRHARKQRGKNLKPTNFSKVFLGKYLEVL